MQVSGEGWRQLLDTGEEEEMVFISGQSETDILYYVIGWEDGDIVS